MKMNFILIVVSSVILLSSCDNNATVSQQETATVADDVLFIVLGKMSLYNQSENGEITLRDHHFVAEIMPKETGEILGGTLTSADDPDFKLDFKPEGRQFLAHGVRVTEPEELHNAHPDGTYLFSYRTKYGVMENQALTLIKREDVDLMPDASILTLSQNGIIISPSDINPEQDLKISWSKMKGMKRNPASDLDDLIFVLGFDCFGNNIAHSGRPYQGTPYLTYKNDSFTIGAENLKPGIQYSLIVEQATADTQTYQDVPGIATYATLTFLNAQTSGTVIDGNTCPTQ
jgi:hypothetical protein